MNARPTRRLSLRARVGSGPHAQDDPGIDPGGVPVAPREPETPAAHELGVDDAQRRATRSGDPGGLAAITQRATCRAGTVDAQLFEPECRHRAVTPGERDAMFTLHRDVEGWLDLVVWFGHGVECCRSGWSSR